MSHDAVSCQFHHRQTINLKSPDAGAFLGANSLETGATRTERRSGVRRAAPRRLALERYLRIATTIWSGSDLGVYRFYRGAQKEVMEVTFMPLLRPQGRWLRQAYTRVAHPSHLTPWAFELRRSNKTTATVTNAKILADASVQRSPTVPKCL